MNNTVIYMQHDVTIKPRSHCVRRRTSTHVRRRTSTCVNVPQRTAPYVDAGHCRC